MGQNPGFYADCELEEQVYYHVIKTPGSTGSRWSLMAPGTVGPAMAASGHYFFKQKHIW